MLPSHRLLARAFQRVPVILPSATTSTTSTASTASNYNTSNNPLASSSSPAPPHQTTLPNRIHHRQLSHSILTPSTSPSSSPSHRQRRNIGTTPTGKWEGRQAKDHTARETDSHNVQQDAVREGKAERAKSEAAGGGKGGKGEEGVSRATSERSGGSHEKTKEEFPEAPDTIGMQDERGGKN